MAISMFLTRGVVSMVNWRIVDMPLPSTDFGRSTIICQLSTPRFYILLQDRIKRVIAFSDIYKGSTNSVLLITKNAPLGNSKLGHFIQYAWYRTWSLRS